MPGASHPTLSSHNWTPLVEQLKRLLGASNAVIDVNTEETPVADNAGTCQVQVRPTQHGQHQVVFTLEHLQICLLCPEEPSAELVQRARGCVEGFLLALPEKTATEDPSVFFDDHPLPMWVFRESDRRFLRVNDAAIHLYGYSREEFLQMTLYDIRPPEEQKRLKAFLRDSERPAFSAGQIVWVHQTKAGERLQVLVSSHATVHQGEQARMVVVVDVTRHMELQDQLQQREQEYRLIAENTVNAILRFDDENHITFASPSSSQLLGLTPEELMGKEGFECVADDDRPRLISELAEARSQRRTHLVMEYRLKHKSGRLIWVETQFTLLWSGFEYCGMVTSTLDITLHMQSREEVLRALNTANEMVNLTAELEEASEPSEVIEVAFRHATTSLGFDYGLFIRMDEHQYALEQHHGLSGEEARKLLQKYLLRSGPRVMAGFVNQKAVFFNADDALCDPGEPLPRPDAFQLALLPIHIQHRLHGFLVFGTLQDRQDFSETTRRMLSAMKERIAHAFEKNYLLEQLTLSREETLRAIGLVLEYRDFETKGHTDRVVDLSELLGQQLDLSEEDLAALRWGAYLHDTGKIAIPDHILLKPGRLTPEEFEVVKKHSEIGFEMLRSIPSLPHKTLEVILHHHERWEGSGYPKGLRGLSIPLVARIFTVVDVYDALVSKRPYKESMPHEAAMEELKRNSGTMFDPEVLRAFERLWTTIPPV
ncbi:HD domain-containing phosphohydrolase [Deinococcus cellulosilyticus]|uniref:Uncharacterized protein n=1 Tax=Deinococcus cellulosilyticus (strain DSM 18568 / NBRC 106333 / KACC 11606 / 5516J-15) TaxID=1223518 RepID=A0A511N7D9_DEIC1|nr:HD domain-containing phosphohydrolase [Deinococcus cellulosilyticus]GEM48331.1 hypothetical protein DC3_39660 [Deinococcus cellulosilyticus NBRC 106333 = KACC 11606]